MIGFILRRLLYTIVVMTVASIAIFYSLRVAPGDPINAILNPTAMEEARDELRTRLGLDLPFYQQYFVYMEHVFTGDFGRSLISGKTIPELVASYGLRTFVLAFTALVIAYGIAIPLGILAAVRHNSIWDQSSTFLANLGMGIPGFWLGAAPHPPLRREAPLAADRGMPETSSTWCSRRSSSPSRASP